MYTDNDLLQAETSTKLASSQKELEQFVKEKDESTLQPLSNVSIREVCKRYFEFKVKITGTNFCESRKISFYAFS